MTYYHDWRLYPDANNRLADGSHVSSCRAREFRDFARLSLVAGALAVVVIDGGDLIWWQVPIEWKVWQIIYDFTVFLLAGHLLGIFMKQESANSGS